MRRILACGDPEILKIAKVGCEQVKTCTEFVKERIQVNRYVLFELPCNAWSWQMLKIVEVARQEGVQNVEGHTRLRAAGDEGRWVRTVGEEADGLDDEQLVLGCCSHTCWSREGK